jgi:DnaJ-domain-containing protein 1
VSFTRRIIDLAKSNLNALLEAAAETTDPRRKLAHIPDEELEAELTRRKAARKAEQEIKDAKARVDAGAGDGDRDAREQAARAREQRVKAARDARQKAAQAEAARIRQNRASSASSSSSSSSSSGGGSRTGQQQRQNVPPPRPAPGTDLRKYYERLELPVGASFDQVKASYRRLMRKYHPDMHAGKTAEKQKAANDVAAALTQAYNELERALGSNKK